MNGARSVVIDIVLNHAEAILFHSQLIIQLLYAPSFVLVKMDHSRAPHFSLESETIIPISPIQKSFWLNLTENPKKVVQIIT